MRAEVVAIGTELLLGQIVDTNSSWIGEQLAVAGIDSLHQTKVGDNLERMVDTINLAISRADAVLICGGLGPTQDDITRVALASIMGVALVRDQSIVEHIRLMFSARGRVMAANNELQADVPVGASIIPNDRGTAPGLICPVRSSDGRDVVVYAMPGVPYEMHQMMLTTVLPDLVERSGEPGTIQSRTLRTWGLAESTLAELIAPRLDELERVGGATIAFLASGMEGIKVRVTTKAATETDCAVRLDSEESALRELLGDYVFGLDEVTMEAAILSLLADRGWTLSVAESITGGLIAQRITDVAGASAVFQGGVVSYATSVKQSLLGVGDGPVVSELCAIEMAVGVQRLMGSSVGLSVTGVAGPAEQDDQPVGTVWCGLALPGSEPFAVHMRLPGDRKRIREFACINSLDVLRRRLL